MEQATDGAETAVSTDSFRHFYFILFMGTRMQIDSVMCPWSSSRERNTSALVTVTVTMCNNNKNQITCISTLQFIHKLHNFVHIISVQSNGAAITLSCIWFPFRRIRQWISIHGVARQFGHCGLTLLEMSLV